MKQIMQASHENRVRYRAQHYNALITPPGHGDCLVGIDYASGWARVTAKSIESITVDPSWAESSRVERFGESRVDRSSRAEIAADRSFWSTRSISGSSTPHWRGEL